MIKTSCLYREPSLIACPFLNQVAVGFGLALKGIFTIIVSPFSNAVADSNRLGRDICGAPGAQPNSRKVSVVDIGLFISMCTQLERNT